MVFSSRPVDLGFPMHLLASVGFSVNRQPTMNCREGPEHPNPRGWQRIYVTVLGNLWRSTKAPRCMTRAFADKYMTLYRSSVTFVNWTFRPQLAWKWHWTGRGTFSHQLSVGREPFGGACRNWTCNGCVLYRGTCGIY